MRQRWILYVRQEQSYRQWNIQAKNHLRAAELDEHCTDGPPTWGQICFANSALDERKKDDKVTLDTLMDESMAAYEDDDGLLCVSGHDTGMTWACLIR